MINIYNDEFKPEDYFHVKYEGDLEYKIPQDLIDQVITDSDGARYSLTINWDEDYPLMYPGVINEMFTVTSTYQGEKYGGYPLAMDENGEWLSSFIHKMLSPDLYEVEGYKEPFVRLSNETVFQDNEVLTIMDIGSYYKYDPYKEKVILTSVEESGYKKGLPTPLYPEVYDTDPVYFRSETTNTFLFSVDAPLKSIHPIFGEDGRYYFEAINEK